MKHEEVVQMSLFTTIKKRYAQITPKQFIATGVFALAFAAAIAGGFASKQTSSAAIFYGRDPNVPNSIDNSSNGGGVGALSKEEFISDVQYNHPSDLQGIYSHFGLQTSEYNRFLSEAKEGVVYKNGTVVVDGEVVMNNTWSIGRQPKSYSWQYPISGVGTYHASRSQDVQGSDLPVYVMFDDDGTVEFVVMKACGNSVGGDKVKSGGECKKLVKTPVENKKNTYKFTSEATTFGLAKIVKYEYFYNDGNGDVKFGETTNGSTAVEKTFTKSATVTVKVTLSLPGGKTKVITATDCKKQVGVVKEEFLHVCQALTKTVIDTKTFRFNVIDKHSNNVKRLSADFTLDDDVTAKGVKTDADNDGYIDRTYTFTDNKAHKVSAVVNFEVDGKIVQSKEDCVATTDKTPECKPNIPVGDERCKDFCKPGVEVGSKECEVLPKTGPAGVAGMFAGVSAAGAALHRLYVNRKRR